MLLRGFEKGGFVPGCRQSHPAQDSHTSCRRSRRSNSLMRRDSVSDSHLPRASAFEPGRWLAEGEPGAAAHAAKRLSMPFGAGPRICPERYLAL